jgi:hypothetical protein
MSSCTAGGLSTRAQLHGVSAMVNIFQFLRKIYAPDRYLNEIIIGPITYTCNFVIMPDQIDLYLTTAMITSDLAQ